MDEQATVSQFLDIDFLDEFVDVIDENRLPLERAFGKLQLNPTDQGAFDCIITIFHAIAEYAEKSGAKYTIPLLKCFIGLVEAMRQTKILFDDLIMENLLLGLDHIRDIVHEVTVTHVPPDPASLQRFQQSFSSIANAKQQDVIQCAKDTLNLLAANLLIDESQNETINIAQTLADESVQIENDLKFFHQLSSQLELRFPMYSGRADRMLLLGKEMNNIAGNTVNFIQLEAAICLHDIGMAFIPDQILYKDSQFSEMERNFLYKHPEVASEILFRLKNWQIAAKIVKQHHERVDGNGYPNKMKAKDIHDGAKIIAILNAFEAMISERSHRPLKKSIIRAVKEINNRANSQFCKNWVSMFNKAIRRRYVN